MKDYSIETLFDDITLKQSLSGYRYSIDPILVSHFAKPAAGDKVIDLGTGCGIIPIILVHKFSPLKIFGVEIQHTLAKLAEYNIQTNKMSDDISIIHSDMKKIGDHINSSSVDMVITNPPYTKENSGRVNPNSERAVARHEIKITLDELVKIASDLLKEQGVFALVYPAKRLPEVLTVLESNGIGSILLRFVYTKKNSEPKLFLLKGLKNVTKNLVVAPPLYIFDEFNTRIDEVERLFK